MFVPRRLVLAGCLLTLAHAAVAQRPARTSPQSLVPSPAFDTSLYNALEWREIGPFRGGRVTAVAGHAAPRGTEIVRERLVGVARDRGDASATERSPRSRA